MWDIVVRLLPVFPDATSRKYERRFQKQKRREATLQLGSGLLNYAELTP